jgi:hypothetical protein
MPRSNIFTNTNLTIFPHELNERTLKKDCRALVPSVLCELRQIYLGLSDCFDELQTKRNEQIHADGIKKGKKLAQLDDAIEVGKRVGEEFLAIFKKQEDFIIIYEFMHQFRILLENGHIKTNELISLRDRANQAKEHLLQAPEIKEVQQFHWCINLLCNFINNYIANVFEPQSRKDINRFFNQWARIQGEAEVQENAAKAQSYSI